MTSMQWNESILSLSLLCGDFHTLLSFSFNLWERVKHVRWEGGNNSNKKGNLQNLVLLACLCTQTEVGCEDYIWFNRLM